ncbi:MAG: DUF4381 family protein [Verrucomicrobia bacterium]|nr:DUF4381 family protein [Verrucomicrobiota bacterium]
MTNASQSPGISFGPGAGGTGGAIGAPTPAPIHDIVGPLPFFSGPLGIIVLVFLLVAVAGGLLWWFLGRKKAKVITPRQAALNALALLRGSVSEGNDHDFGVGVSDVIRRFLGEALGLAAPRQTTEEFLGSLRGSLRFVPVEQEALGEFLHRSDYLKFAQGAATLEQRIALIEAAESFVRSGERPPEHSPVEAEPKLPVAPAIPGKEVA